MPNEAYSISINPLLNDFIKTINESLSKCFSNKFVISSEEMDLDRSPTHLGGNMPKISEEFSKAHKVAGEIDYVPILLQIILKFFADNEINCLLVSGLGELPWQGAELQHGGSGHEGGHLVLQCSMQINTV